MNSICVFCGSSPGNDPAYAEAAQRLGRTLAGRGTKLIYGGGHVGLMGVVADAALEAGGEVIGVMPRLLVDREIGHKGVTKLHVVGSMHERKALMSELADGFVALPGGNAPSRSSSRFSPGPSSASTASPAACSTSPATTTRCSPSSTGWSTRISSKGRTASSYW